MTTALSLPTAPLSTSSTNSARDTETKSGDNSAERKQLELSQTSISTACRISPRRYGTVQFTTQLPV